MMEREETRALELDGEMDGWMDGWMRRSEEEGREGERNEGCSID